MAALTRLYHHFDLSHAVKEHPLQQNDGWPSSSSSSPSSQVGKSSSALCQLTSCERGLQLSSHQIAQRSICIDKRFSPHASTNSLWF